jgi:hypothetical protein
VLSHVAGDAIHPQFQMFAVALLVISPDVLAACCPLRTYHSSLFRAVRQACLV